MLQQTQVKTAIPYYNRFLDRFPDIHSLAGAQEQEVLELWSGLGYYSRARNIHKASRIIIERHREFPEKYEDILNLPGIGRYTAGAICSIAFNQAQPIVDGNIQRVISRLHGLKKAPAPSYFWTQMSVWIPKTKASEFNQAMMELGAMICVTSQPLCLKCPVQSLCEAFCSGRQLEIPIIQIRKPAKQIFLLILALERKDKILLISGDKPLFIPGEWGLPCVQISKSEDGEEAAKAFCREIVGTSLRLEQVARINHSITRYRISAFVYRGHAISKITLPDIGVNCCWLDKERAVKKLTSSLFKKALQIIGT